MFVQSEAGLLYVLLLHSLIDCFAAAAVWEGKQHKEAEVVFLWGGTKHGSVLFIQEFVAMFVEAKLVHVRLLCCCK